MRQQPRSLTGQGGGTSAYYSMIEDVVEENVNNTRPCLSAIVNMQMEIET